MPQRLKPTYTIIFINIIVYILTSIIGGNFISTDEGLLMQYGQWNYMVLQGGYWQLLTSIFIHVNIIHIAVNMLFLLIFGLRAEELFTVKEYLAIYVVSGLAGNLSTLLLGPYVVSAGAIFGLFGACLIYIRHAFGQPLIIAILYGVLLLMLGNAPDVNFMAHLGGLAAGLIMGYSAASRRRKQITYHYTFSYSQAR